jgi:hypothetical protein
VRGYGVRAGNDPVDVPVPELPLAAS